MRDRLYLKMIKAMKAFIIRLLSIPFYIIGIIWFIFFATILWIPYILFCWLLYGDYDDDAYLDVSFAVIDFVTDTINKII